MYKRPISKITQRAAAPRSVDQRCTDDDLAVLYQGRDQESYDSGIVADASMEDLSAEAIGVNIASTKIKAFALCGGLAGVSGALYGSLIQSVTPEFFDLKLSIQYVAMMVVGGSGTILGSILGAVAIIGLDRLTDRFKWIFTLPGVRNVLFFVSTSSNESVTTTGVRGFIDRMQIELPNFVRLIYGLLIVLSLRYFPNGIAALWDRIKRFFVRWPFAR